MNSTVVLDSVDASDGAVTAAWRQAVVRGLAAAAAAQGVVVCHGGEPSRPGCAPEVLTEAPKLHWSIGTAVTVQHSLALIRMPLTLEVVAGPEVTPPEPGLFVIEENFVLPANAAAGERDPLLANRVGDILASHDAVQRWFARVRATPGLESSVPLPPLAATDAESGPETSAQDPTDKEAAAWQRQEARILDLLIDDRFAEARRTADRLLAMDGLPPDQRERVLRLRATALEWESKEAEEETEPEAEAPSATPEQPFDYTFTVRVAAPGRGLLRGTDGRLRLFHGGVRFVPTGETGDGQQDDGWYLRWSEIRAWGEADGLWDVDHPLKLTATDGESIYFAQIDHDGRFRSGTRILSLLSRGAERARKR